MDERQRPLGGRRIAAVMVLCLAALAAGCETLKPYEKEYLLSPAMDDRAADGLRPALMSSAAGSVEKLGAGGPGAGGSSSCPTCGG